MGGPMPNLQKLEEFGHNFPRFFVHIFLIYISPVAKCEIMAKVCFEVYTMFYCFSGTQTCPESKSVE